MKVKVRICAELTADDPDIGIIPVEMALEGNASGPLPPYEETVEQIDKAAFLASFSMDRFAQPSGVKFITPEEFDEKYGEDDGNGGD